MRGDSQARAIRRPVVKDGDVGFFRGLAPEVTTMSPFSLERFAIVGESHHIYGQESQDSVLVTRFGKSDILLVSDGVGSCIDSKVGSIAITQIAARVLSEEVHYLEDLFEDDSCLGNTMSVAHKVLVDGFIIHICSRIRAALALVKAQFTHYPKGNDPLAATLLGAVITPQIYCAFRCGDGVYALNGEVRVLECRAHNQPEYPALSLSGHAQIQAGFLSLLECGFTSEVTSLLIATDGASQLLANAVGLANASEFTLDNLRAVSCGTRAGDDVAIASARRVS
jgi:hypothetical protein